MKGKLLVAGLTALGVASVATGAGPPPPKAVAGHPVAVVARGVPTPTTFAFGAGQVFVAGFGSEDKPTPVGGVYVLKGGKPVRIPGSPPHVFGLAWSKGTLYVSGGARVGEIDAWSGWNGKRFAKSRDVAHAPKGVTAFNGIAVSADGTLYAGISLGDAKKADYSRGVGPYANSVVRIDPASGKLTVVSTGMRQPWQPVFVPGHRGPLIADLGQENLGKTHPVDRIVEIKQGANFGFPSCPAKPATCSKYAKPFAVFPAHSSPMGLAPLGGKLYVALFSGTGKGPMVVAMSEAGGRYVPVLTGFPAPVVALGAHDGKIYAGDLTGSIYSFTP